MQRALLQYRNPKYYNLVYEALTESGKTDLIGNSPKCLIRDKFKNHKSGNRNDKFKLDNGKNKLKSNENKNHKTMKDRSLKNKQDKSFKNSNRGGKNKLSSKSRRSR